MDRIGKEYDNQEEEKEERRGKKEKNKWRNTT